LRGDNFNQLKNGKSRVDRTIFFLLQFGKRFCKFKFLKPDLPYCVERLLRLMIASRNEFCFHFGWDELEAPNPSDRRSFSPFAMDSAETLEFKFLSKQRSSQGDDFYVTRGLILNWENA
jgi:hypothetical protein